MKEMLDRALADRYGVAAFNILNDLTVEAVLAAATEEHAPVILQTSVKTVRQYGRDQLFGIFTALARDVPVPVTLHLDHCPDRSVISDCLAGGWNSVLFDAHERVTDLVEATGVPMALHGGTGLSDEQFTDLIARGCAKVNISTALKEVFMKSGREFLAEAGERGA